MSSFSPDLRVRAALCPAAILILLVAGCGTKENNGLGVQFIEDRGDRKAVVYLELTPPDTTDDHQSETLVDNLGSSGTLTFGARAGYLAKTLVKIDSTQAPAAGTTLTDATLRLALGDSLGTTPLSVAVHPVTSGWDATLNDPASFPTLAAAVDTVDLNLTREGADSLLGSRFSILSVAQSWVDDPASNRGVAFIPIDGSDVMLEFDALEGGIQPEVTFAWNTGTVDTTASVFVSNDNYVLEKTPAFVPLDGQPGRITVGRGYPTRSYLFFDIPELGDRATINRAELVLHLDSTMSDLSSFPLAFRRITGAGWQGDSTEVEAIQYGNVTLSSGADSVASNATSLVASIVESTNLGILVQAAEERGDGDYARFHSEATAMPELAPTLRIWYTPGDEPETAE